MSLQHKRDERENARDFRTRLTGKGFTKTKNAGPLVSNQEQSAILVPLLNRLSIACYPVVMFLHRFTWISLVPGNTFYRNNLERQTKKTRPTGQQPGTKRDSSRG